MSDERRRRRVKDPATLRAELGRAAGGVAPQSQNPTAMLLRRVRQLPDQPPARTQRT
jgi:hypothetical protein